MLSSRQMNESEYAVLCVSHFAKRYGLVPTEAFRYLDVHGGIRLLKEHYDILHTLPLGEALNDLSAVCRRNGGVLA